MDRILNLCLLGNGFIGDRRGYDFAVITIPKEFIKLLINIESLYLVSICLILKSLTIPVLYYWATCH